jgi:sec-independent protein translocase protein TatA
VPFDVSIPELLIILVAVLLIFGPKRLPEMGRSLGRGLRQFRESVSGLDELTTTSAPSATRAGAAESTAAPTSAPDPAGTADTDSSS